MSSEPFLPPALRTLLGTIRLRVVGGTGRFIADGASRVTAEVAPPGAVLGRAESADVCLRTDDLDISRHHMLLQPLGRFWTVADCGSTHGTVAVLGDSTPVDLAPDVPFPVHGGMRLTLAYSVTLRLELAGTSSAPELPTRAGDPNVLVARISNPDLQRLADALTAPLRRDPRSVEILTVEDLATSLGCSRRTVYNWLEALSRVPAVARRLPDARRGAVAPVAHAVARAFPYLVVPRRTI